MAGHGGLAVSDHERGYYGSLWAQADSESVGRLGGLQAVTFLSRSGLDRRVLKQVWDVADRNVQGWLGPEEFFTALRLVAHAQAGRQVTPDMAYLEPPSLPRFDASGAGPFATAPGTGGAPPASSRGRSPGRGGDRLMPTPRDLRKYGRLFTQTLAGRGSSLSADSARGLFEKSGLGGGDLAQVWDLADADRDGRLSWQEFVAAMHLIRRIRAGQPLPQTMPVDLRNLIATLDTAESYAAQASRSPRALSTSSARSLFDSTPSVVGGGGGAREVGPASSWDDLGPSASAGNLSLSEPEKPSGGASAWGGAGAGSFGGDGGFGFGDAGEEQLSLPKSKKDKGGRSKHKLQPDMMELPTSPTDGRPAEPSPTSSPAFGFGGGGGGGFGGAGGASGRDGQSPDFGDRRGYRADSNGGFFGGAGGPGDNAQPVEHLEALIEAEKHLVGALRADTSGLNEDLTKLEDACRFEEKESARERAECDRIGQERKLLEQQLEASRRELMEMKSEHEGLHLESILLRRDRGHYGGEVSFMQRLFDEGSRDAQALQQSIEYLEQSNQSLSSHTKSLEEARRDILEQLRTEKDLLRKEEGDAQSAKQALETLRGGAGSLSQGLGIGRLGGATPNESGFGPSAFDDPAGFAAGSVGGGGGGGAFGGLQTMAGMVASAKDPGAGFGYDSPFQPPGRAGGVAGEGAVAMRDGV